MSEELQILGATEGDRQGVTHAKQALGLKRPIEKCEVCAVGGGEQLIEMLSRGVIWSDFY